MKGAEIADRDSIAIDETTIWENLLKWDFNEEFEEGSFNQKKSETVFLQIYHNLKKLFSEFFTHFARIQRASKQLCGIAEEFGETTASVRQAARFIAEGSKKQSSNADRCIQLTTGFFNKMDMVEKQSAVLLNLAVKMEAANQTGYGFIRNLSSDQDNNRKAIGELVEKSYRVVEKANNVEKVSDFLSAIAKQTELLAINAKIEAVRAGQYGKPFSVVADELKRLSNESKTASNDINAIVNDILDELCAFRSTLDASTQIFKNQDKSFLSVVKAFGDISGYIKTFIERHNNFHEQFGIIKNNQNELTNCIHGICSGIRESVDTTEELYSLSITQNSNAAVLNKLAFHVTNHVEALKNNFDRINMKRPIDTRKKILVIFAMNDAFWAIPWKAGIKAAKSFDMNVEFFAPSSKTTGVEEIEHKLDELEKDEVDAVIISPINDVRIKAKLNELDHAGTRTIFINSKVDNVKYTSLIETNGFAAGKYAAEATKKFLNNQGEALVGLWTDVHVDSIENRAKGFIDGLKTTSTIKVNEVGIKSNLSFEDAEKSISAMLEQYPKTKLFFATNVGWGIHYASYLKKHKLDYKVITMDFTNDVKGAIREGLISSAIAQRTFSWVPLSLEIADKLFAGETVQKYIDTGTYEVNLSNLKIYENRI